MSKKTVKMSDPKGRLSLGQEFANRSFIIKRTDGGLLLTPAAVIPESELWLHNNQDAMKMVQDGLAAARKGEFGETPDYANDAMD